MRGTVLAVLLVLVSLGGPARAAGPTSAASPDAQEAVRRCLELQPIFVRAPGGITVAQQDGGDAAPFGVRVTWTAGPDEPAGWYVCWFQPRRLTAGEWQIAQAESSRFGRMSRYDVQQAYKMLRAMTYAPAAPLPAPTVTVRALQVLQLLIDTIGLAAVYALLATAFTLIFGITRVLNVAFGDVHTLGAYLFAVLWTGWLQAVPLGLALPLAALAIAATTGLLGRVVWPLALRGPAARSPTAALIGSVGLGIALMETVRLTQGAKTRFLLVARDNGWPVVTGHGFDVWLSRGHLMLLAVLPPSALALWWLLQRTRLGLAMRACAQDARTAALLGVDVGRSTGLAFALGSALAGLAGFVVAAQYGVITPAMGWIASLKALTAALLGGIGSIPGAVVGAFVLAAVEVGVAFAFGSAWKDVWVFAVLLAVLIARPQGLLGTAGRRTPEPV